MDNKLQEALRKTALHGILWIVGILAIYIVLAIGCPYLKPNFNLLDVVVSHKLASLFVSVFVGAIIAYNIDPKKEGWIIKSSNYFVVAIAIILIPILWIKFAGYDVQTGELDPSINAFSQKVLNNMYWISVAPIAGYALIDLYKFSCRRGGDKERLSNLMYLFFVDCASVLPFFVVLCVVYFYKYDRFTELGISQELNMINPELVIRLTKFNLELFINGSMAILILSHSLLARVVEIFIKYMFEEPNKAPFKID